ncbi:MAG: zinc dependent phospholipase C family protein [Clostridia bacterium]|nr:zinc dependent phospholipase C family protein [Clostridia bacterium]
MPASYTHYLVAHEAYFRLSRALQENLQPHLRLYYFGAQGADFGFFYPVFNGSSPRNLGSILHRRGGYAASVVCKAFASRSTPILAYSLGFLTHYATDTVFHPFVYAHAGKSPLRHSRIEQALDCFLQRETAHAQYFQKPPAPHEREELFQLYGAIVAYLGLPPLKKTAFQRAITLFHAHLPLSSLLFSSKRTDALCNAHNGAWSPPSDPQTVRTDGGKELFQEAVQTAVLLFEEFLSCMKNKTPLPRALFGKNYLSGL